MGLRRKAVRGFFALVVLSQILFWGSVYFDKSSAGIAPETRSVREDEERKITIEKYSLTECSNKINKNGPKKSFEETTEGWIEKRIMMHLRGKETLVCKMPPQKEKHWSTIRSFYFEKSNILALSEDDYVSLIHEGLHAVQVTPEAFNNEKKKTAAYQTLIAREIGGLCLSVLDSFQRDPSTSSTLWKEDSNRTFAEYSVLDLLEEIIQDYPSDAKWREDPNLRPPAKIADELIYHSLKKGIVFSNYDTSFYDYERDSLMANIDLDFTPLTKDEISLAISGRLYTKESLPKSIQFINNLGQRASSAAWYIERMERDYFIRTNTIRGKTRGY